MIKHSTLANLLTVVALAKPVFDNCFKQSDLEKLLIMSKEIQVQVEAIKPKQNVVELRLP